LANHRHQEWVGLFMVHDVAADLGWTAKFRQSHAALGTSQKTSKGVSFYSKLVNRPLGRIFAAAAFAAGLSPNMVTAVSGLATGLGLAVLVLVHPSIGSGIVVSLLLAVGFALDSADGQVARLTATSSAAGEWLDHTLDAAKMVLLHAAVLVGWYRFLDLSDAWLLVPLGYQAVSVVTFSGGTLVALLKRAAARSAGAAVVPLVQQDVGGERHSVVRALLLIPGDFGILCLLFALWGWVDVFRYGYLVMLVLNAGLLAALLVKWFRELSRVKIA
jgi:phosphatidylglycerophosphate synthase